MEDHLNIGAIVFPKMDQMDFTGPFEVLSRLPNAKFHVLWEHTTPILDVHGLIITPDTTFSESPRLDLLVVPGGLGQEALMNDEAALTFLKIRQQQHLRLSSRRRKTQSAGSRTRGLQLRDGSRLD